LSLSKRIIDLAKANLNALLDKAGAPESAVDDLTDEELEAELARRRARRLREDTERRDREAAERAARERAQQRAQERRQAAPPGRTTGNPGGNPTRPTSAPPPRNGSSQRRTPPPRSAPPGSERRLRELYAQLEVPYGAPFDEVKKSFRRLMRKYHPDLHVGNPVKHKTATQLTMSLTQAYNELEVHLVGGPNK
jgi:DnaJ-domain-containing protein 1